MHGNSNIKLIQNTWNLNTLRGKMADTFRSTAQWPMLHTTPFRNTLKSCLWGVRSCGMRYTLSAKLSDFTTWRCTWRKSWVNCAVLIGNSAALRTVLSSRLSHTELRSSLRESHSFISLPAFIHHSHTHKKTHRTIDNYWYICQLQLG